MSASETTVARDAALDVILNRASAVTLKAPGPSPDDLRTILRAGTRAPDHGKLEPWRFVVIEGSARDRLGDVMAASMKARNPAAEEIELKRERDKVFRAPTVVAVAVHYTGEKHPKIEQQCAVAAAAENMILAAVALGYGTMWKTGAPAYDPQVKALLGLQETDDLLGFLYFGTAEAMPKSERPTKFDEVVRWL